MRFGRRLLGATPNIRWLLGGIVVIVLVCALIMRLLPDTSFPTYGEACWWAVQTVTTVGYGDVVPKSVAGKFVAGVLMIVAVAFVSLLTASISASFVRRSQQRRGLDEHQQVLDALARVEQRLAELERRS